MYSGADEAAHYDYINHIIDRKKLPTMDDMINSQQLNFPEANPATIPNHNQHEAVQPPLYYLLSAIIGGQFNDLYTRLIILRFLGIIGLMISFFITIKTYRLLVDRKQIRENNLLFMIISLLLILSPNFQRVMIPLNNEHLLLVLVTMLIYFLVKYSENEKITLKQSVIIGVLLGLVILTKITAGYLAVLVVILFLSKKWIRPLFVTGGTALLSVIPWICFNIIHYQNVTGTKRHIEIVEPIVNPGNYNFTIVDVVKFTPDFLTSIWFWEGRYPIERILADFLAFVFVLSLLFAVIKIKEKPNTIFSLSLLGNIGILVLVTIFTPIASMIGRYMYMNYLASVIALFIFTVSVVDDRYHRWCYWLYGLAGAIFTTSHIIELIKT